MSDNLMESMMMKSDVNGEFDISSIAMYKPFEGLLELRVVSVYTLGAFLHVWQSFDCKNM